MSTFNRILIYGIMGQTPVLKTTQKGKPYSRLSIATHYKRKEDSENTTTWHSVHFFGKQAEIAVKNLRLGAFIFVEGRVEQSSRVGADGRLEYKTWIVGQRLHFVGKKEHPQDPDGEDLEDIKETELEEVDKDEVAA